MPCRRSVIRCMSSSLSSSSSSQMSVVVVTIAIAATLLRVVTSLPIVKSTRVDGFGHIRSNYETREQERPDLYVTPHLHTLVNTLEAAGILEDGNGTNCFILDKITKEWQPPVEGVSVVQVSLQLKQFQVPDGTRERIGVSSPGRGQEKSRGNGENDVSDSAGACLEIFSRPTTLASTFVVSLANVYQGALDEDDISVTLISGGRNITSHEEVKSKPGRKTEEHTGLNKRQILVISTCSTVIGAFFITAFILRIRNYMKRSKQDKDSTRRHMRAASMPHQRTHHGSLDHFATNDNSRRWSHFNPFNTDR